VELPHGPPPTPKYAPPSGGIPKETHGARRPRIVFRPIPFPAKRRKEMAAYSKRHYGIDDYRLVSPQVIVEHYTELPSVAATYAFFAPDRPDSELHELPNVCSHFVVDTSGTIFQLVPLRYMCRHTVGLNDTAIGVEHVGSSDAQILANPSQLKASFALTRWLRCRYGISLKNVIGHNESLDSPFHRERVKRLREQTHGDWTHDDMKVYRRKLKALGGC
jgi:N-acetylmuramoyl-L-alanine amidase